MAITSVIDMSKVQICENAVGRITIETESFWLSWKINLLIKFKYQFKRKGRFILGLDEIVYRSFVKSGLIINSGWDIWCGYDWSADNVLTDQFLTDFYHKHLK